MSKRPEWWLALLAKIWPLTWISAQACQWPVVGPLIAKASIPFFSGRNLNISYLPINEELDGGSTLLPIRVVEEFIERSSHRVILKRCTCRDARQCENHPVDLGCMLLGEGTRHIDPRIVHHISREEAVAHLHRCVTDGLVPMIGRVKIDNLIWGVPDEGKMLTICFCCSCCCTLWTSGKYLPREAAASMVRLKGLEMKVDHDECRLCGTCVGECNMAAISIVGDRVVHDMTKCIGCGWCVTVCPWTAITPEIKDVDDALGELRTRIETLVDVE